MKLLIVLPCYFPATRFGGPIKSVHAVARELVAQGVEVSVFTTNSDGPQDLGVVTGKATPLDGVQVTYFPVRWPRGYFRSPALKAALRLELSRFDLVYAPWVYAYTTAVTARECIRQNVPYVLSPRGMLDRDSIARKGSLKKRLYLAAIESRHYQHAAAVHFTTQGERDVAVDTLTLDRSLVIPNGIDLRDEVRVPDPRATLDAMGIPGGKPLVLFLGRLSYIKGVELLGRAWPLVVKREPTAHLVLAGADDEGLLAPLLATLAAQGLSSSVTYVGIADSVQKTCLLRACTVLASPSISESFGMSIVEALAEGKPVVITEGVKIAAAIGDAGAGIVTPHRPEEIADGIATLVADAGLAARMGAAGRRLVELEYSLASVARRMNDAFADIVARTHRPSEALLAHPQ